MIAVRTCDAADNMSQTNSLLAHIDNHGVARAPWYEPYRGPFAYSWARGGSRHAYTKVFITRSSRSGKSPSRRSAHTPDGERRQNCWSCSIDSRPTKYGQNRNRDGHGTESWVGCSIHDAEFERNLQLGYEQNRSFDTGIQEKYWCADNGRDGSYWRRGGGDTDW